MDPEYPPSVYVPLIASIIAVDYPRIIPDYAVNWMTIESDGAPCAVGSLQQHGPDGQPREIGLGQIYNPDDFDRLGLTQKGIKPATFRAYCVPGTQKRSRTLTSQEMDALVRYTLLAKIDQCMHVVDHAVATYSLSHWPSSDYWKLFKAPHAWPPILNTGMPAVIHKLGRAPKDWLEFRAVLGMDANPTWKRALDNCEKCAHGIGDATGNVA